jgi:hypothetical protein
MSEALVLVCDRCGQAAVETVSLRAGGANLVIDLCRDHLGELLAGARTPKRGRKPTTLTLATPRGLPGRPRKTATKTARKETHTKKKSTSRGKAGAAR